MFKKLKEKVIDSQTSQRFQQITQTVSDKLQNLDKDENFFSLTEDDNAIGSPTTSTIMEPGFANISLTSSPEDTTNKIRRTSISSMASDISFLPRYDSFSSIYHLQSDLDISASEIEDNVSTASSQIGHLTKEQIYAAFQKSQMRYHKYRGRFTDLAKHYKNLEREFTKLKTELEKTQERLFRRVKEFKEQGELEQKAKAHLESSLRLDLDEKQMQINTLREKISLLQTNSSSLVDFELLTKNLNETKQENDNLNSANQEMKAKLIVLQSKENECKEKIKKLCEEIEKLKENEQENNMKLAQKKMELHEELLSKETRLNNLLLENENLKKNLDAYETKSEKNSRVEHLENHNKILVEKVDSLLSKCQNLTAENLKVAQYEIEMQNLKTRISEEKNAHDQEIMKISKEAEVYKAKLLKEKHEMEKVIDNLKKTITETTISHETEVKELEEAKRNVENEIVKIREDTKSGIVSIEERLRSGLENELEIATENIKKIYEEKLKTLAAENENLKENKSKYEYELKSAEESKQGIEEDLFKMKEKYTELEQSFSELNLDLDEERRKLENLKKETSKESKNSSYELEFNNLNDLYEKQKVDIKTLLDKQNENEEKIKKLMLELNSNKDISYTKDDYQSLQSNYDSLEMQRNNIMHELDALKEEFEKLSEYNANDQKIIEEYKEDKHIKEKLVENLEIAVAHASKENETTLKLYKELQTKLINITEMETESTDCKKILCQKVYVEFKTLIDRCEGLLRKYELVSSDNVLLKGKILEIEKTLRENEKSSKNKMLKIEELESLNSNYLDRINKVQTELENSKELLRQKDDKIKELSSEIEAKIQFINNLEENCKIFQKSDKNLKKEIESFKCDINLKSNELIKLQEMLSKERKDTVKELNNLKEVEKNFYKLLDENENLKEQNSEIAILQKKLKSLSEVEIEKTILNEKFINSERGNEKILNELDQLKTTNGILLSKIDVLQEKCNEQDKIENELKTLKENHEILKITNNSKNLEHDNLLNDHKNLLLEKNKLFEELLEMKNEGEKENLIREISSLKEKLKILYDEKQYSDNLKIDYNKTLAELEIKSDDLTKLQEENLTLEHQNRQISKDIKNISEENNKLVEELEELKLNIENYSTIQVELEEKEIKLNKEKQELSLKLKKYLDENNDLKNLNSINEESNIKDIEQSYSELNMKFDELNIENKKLKNDLEELSKTVENFKEEKRKRENLINELESNEKELLNEKQLLKEEIEELKITPINLNSAKKLNSNKINNLGHKNGLDNNDDVDTEYNEMAEKLIQLKSLDITNKATIAFYENEVVKLKNNNEKLNRRLDETLVTLNHCSELSHSTELEYLKNVLYNYMLGKEGVTLAKVIATVCKFDDEQTEEILKRENQKQTLLAKLGLL